jgi:hypothetical protein
LNQTGKILASSAYSVILGEALILIEPGNPFVNAPFPNITILGDVSGSYL